MHPSLCSRRNLLLSALGLLPMARLLRSQQPNFSTDVKVVNLFATVRDKDGRIVTVTRKPFTRRTLKADVWKYHLREMAAQDEPLRYIRRFLVIEGDVPKSKTVAS